MAVFILLHLCSACNTVLVTKRGGSGKGGMDRVACEVADLCTAHRICFRACLGFRRHCIYSKYGILCSRVVQSICVIILISAATALGAGDLAREPCHLSWKAPETVVSVAICVTPSQCNTGSI